MPAYETLHARHYDLIYADKPYGPEAQFVAERLAGCGVGAGASVLDVACGTGRHAVELAKLGYAVTGLDLNPALIERARANAQQAGVAIDFLVGDMRSWTNPGSSRFDAATCLFDSLGYAGPDESVLSTLRSIAAALVERGVLVLEVLNAEAMIHNADPVRVRSWGGADGTELLRIGETEVDPATGRFTVTYRLLELRTDGTYSQERDMQATRAFFEPDLRALLEEAGYEIAALEPAYRAEGEIDQETWHLLVSARLR